MLNHCARWLFDDVGHGEESDLPGEEGLIVKLFKFATHELGLGLMDLVIGEVDVVQCFDNVCVVESCHSEISSHASSFRYRSSYMTRNPSSGIVAHLGCGRLSPSLIILTIFTMESFDVWGFESNGVSSCSSAKRGSPFFVQLVVRMRGALAYGERGVRVEQVTMAPATARLVGVNRAARAGTSLAEARAPTGLREFVFAADEGIRVVGDAVSLQLIAGEFDLALGIGQAVDCIGRFLLRALNPFLTARELLLEVFTLIMISLCVRFSGLSPPVILVSLVIFCVVFRCLPDK